MARQRQRALRRLRFSGRTLDSPPPLTAFPAVGSLRGDNDSNGNSNNHSPFSVAVKTQHRVSLLSSEPLTPLTECSSASGSDDNDDGSATATELCVINSDSNNEEGKELAANDDSPMVPVNLDRQFTLASSSGIDDEEDDDDDQVLLALIMGLVVPPSTNKGDAWTDSERELASDFLEALQDGMKAGLVDGAGQATWLQQLVEVTCDSFQDRFDELYYDGETGAFLHYCRLIGATEEEFDKAIQDAMDGYSQLVQEEQQQQPEESVPPTLTVTPEQISQYLEQIGTSCWQCKSCPGVPLLSCCLCGIPRYCTQHCQAKAWEEGHHLKCGALRNTHRIMKDTLATISQVAVARSIHGIHTHPYIDFAFATMVMDPQLHSASPWGSMTTTIPMVTNKLLEGPSMTFYYQNLAAIQRGEWWIFTDACTESHYEQVVASKADDLAWAQQHGELPHVNWLGWVQLLLTYNLQGAIDDANKAALVANHDDDAMDDSLVLSCLTCLPVGSPPPRDLFRLERMNSSLTMKDWSARSSSSTTTTSLVDSYEMDSATVEALIHPGSWIQRFRDFYGVSMPSEVFLKHFTLDEPHDMTMEEIKERRDFAKWFVYQDLLNVHHK